MRNIKDFRTPDEVREIIENVRKFDTTRSTEKQNQPNRIIFAEIYTRFYREYTEGVPPEWSIAFYKITSFDVL